MAIVQSSYPRPHPNAKCRSSAISIAQNKNLCFHYLYKEANPPFELFLDSQSYRGGSYEDRFFSGKVIGEFVCDKVFLLHPYTYDGGNADRESRKLIQTFEGSSRENEILAATCLTQDEMFDYIGAGNYGYGWHISDLKIYDFPLTLDDFYLEKHQ